MENHEKFNKDINKELKNFKTKDERIAEYFENPDSFDWNQGKCIGEDEE
ncbi:hypothetical protein LCGC14_0632560 [marine sediment metagenome]|uniref:Uncharacterized protein n=1 Tax=marine sediment metagenome TaxID=412755 RepID=A0A0F9TMX0_9ZZZZ